jgi:hypothetical protein
VRLSVAIGPRRPTRDVVWLTLREYVPLARGFFLDRRGRNWGRPVLFKFDAELLVKEPPSAAAERVHPQTAR